MLQSEDLAAGDEPRKLPKTTLSNVALTLAVMVRFGDFATDMLVFFDWWYDEHTRAWAQAAILAFVGAVTGWVAYIRQTSYERLHEPRLSAFLAVIQIQPIIELWDSLVLGNKTTALKLHLNYSALCESLPSLILQSYIGYSRNVWGNLLGISVVMAFLNVAVTLVSAEKEQYLARGLGKLPLLSTYSVVLLLFRMIELPSRILTLTLWTAEFQWFIVLIFVGDILFLRLIRFSTFQRVQDKKARSKAALSRSLARLNKSVDNLDALEELLEEDFTGIDNMSREVLGIHLVIWFLVYLDGVDAFPYLLLRMIEEAILVVTFAIRARETVEDDYQLFMVIVAGALLFVHLVYSAAWAFFRSHAEFLHPQREPDELKLKIMKHLEGLTQQHGLVESESDSDDEADKAIEEARAQRALKRARERELEKQQELAERLRQDAARHSKKKRPSAAQQARAKAAREKVIVQTIPQPASPEPASEQESSVSEVEEPYESDGDDGLPNNVITEVVVREVPVTVKVPAPGQRRTQAVQYDWRDYADEPDVPESAPVDPIEAQSANKQTEGDDDCILM